MWKRVIAIDSCMIMSGEIGCHVGNAIKAMAQTNVHNWNDALVHPPGMLFEKKLKQKTIVLIVPL